MTIFNDIERDRINIVKSIIERKLQTIRGSIVFPFNFEVVLAGGMIANAIRSEPTRDYDFFILCGGQESDFKAAKSKVEMSSLSPVKTTTTTKYFSNPWIWDVWTFFVHGIEVQLIFSKFLGRDTLLSNFDFKHCMASYSVNKGEFYIRRSVYDAIDKKMLITNELSLDPPKPYRVEKFQQRGYDLSKLVLPPNYVFNIPVNNTTKKQYPWSKTSNPY